MANTKLPSRLLDTSAIPALNVTGDLTVDTTTLKVDSTNNRVGIGIASPSTSLHLKASNNAYSGGFRIEGTDETTALAITHVNGVNYFSGNGTDDHLMLTGTGSVGIGTATPGTYQLAVNSGTAGVSDALAGIYVNGQRSGVVYNLVSNNTGNAANRGSGIQFRHAGFLSGAIIHRTDGTAASGDAPGYMTFHTSSDNSEDLAERMRIDSSGNVLVGKTAADFDTVGAEMRADGRVIAVRNGDPMYVTRNGSDGGLINFRKDGAPIGGIGVDFNDNLYLTGKSDHAGIMFSNIEMYPYKNGTYVDATIDIGASSGRWKDLYLSGGVYLGGTGADNKLDDYEEGTWTPRIDGTTTAGTHTYLQQDGFYVKVGKLVTITGTIYGSGGTGAGNLLLKGLPFTYISHHGGHGTFQVNGSMPFPTGTITAVFVTDNAGGFYVRCTKDNANMEYLAYPVTVNYLRFTFSYFTDQ